ncbi:MAG: peroxiredoxin, partial [Gemmatimonadales bacterium]
MKKGDLAPDFTAVNQTGATVQLSDMLADGPVVLFFYPKAFTPGCTKESCHVRDLAVEFAELGAQRVGISADDTSIQAKFDAVY